MRSSTEPDARQVAGLVVVTRRGAASGGRIVLHPYGVSALHENEPPGIALAGTHQAAEEITSWAWGHVAPSGQTPHVWFESRSGLRSVPALTRRLTSRLWTAEAPGSWPFVRIQ